MRILVLNGGSSSIKFSVFSCGDVALTDQPLAADWDGQLSGIGGAAAILKTSGAAGAGSGDGKQLRADVDEAAEQ